MQKLRLLFIICFFLSCEIGNDIVSSSAKNIEEIKIYKDGNLETSELSIIIADSTFITAKFFRNNKKLNISNFTWHSNNINIASVTSAGKILGKNAGQTTIVATYNNITMSVLVSVVANMTDLAKIIISAPNKFTFSLNDTVRLFAKSYTLSNVEIFDKTYTWSSSNNNLASVNSKGLVTFLQAGSATIKATSESIESLGIVFTILDLNQTRTGSIESVSHGTSHKGTVTLKFISGVLTLVLGSDFQTVSGPDLHVTLASKKITYTSGDIDLGVLKSTSGMQTYTIPSNIKINDFAYVQVWCKAFNSVFCTAVLN
jgi:hypothetical protein